MTINDLSQKYIFLMGFSDYTEFSLYRKHNSLKLDVWKSLKKSVELGILKQVWIASLKEHMSNFFWFF